MPDFLSQGDIKIKKNPPIFTALVLAIFLSQNKNLLCNSLYLLVLHLKKERGGETSPHYLPQTQLFNFLF